MWSLDSSALLPSSVMVWPFTVTRPDLISSSAWRREAMPARAIIFCSRSSMGRRLAPWCVYSLTEKWVWSEWEARTKAAGAKEELQRLKPYGFCEVYVVAEATTHKPTATAARFDELWPLRVRYEGKRQE